MSQKQKIETAEACALAEKGLRKGGILLTTKAGDTLDSMVIGWGTFGINWARPVAVVYVRRGRDTRGLLDANPEFTLNIPEERLTPQVLKVCGTMHRSQIDKAAELGFTEVPSDAISVPGIREVPITIECRVIYRQEQELALYSEEMQKRFYPEDKPSDATGSNRDVHIAYYGEIVGAYRIVE